MLPSLEVGAETLDFSDDTELKISLTATREWQIRTKPDWIAVDPDHGPASDAPQRVLVSVLPNSDYNRTGEVVFTIGLAKAAVSIIQPGAKGELPKGTGTLEDPFTVAGVLEYIKSLGNDVESSQDVCIKGKISAVTAEYSSQFGNGTFIIKGESEDETFTVYRAMYLGNKKWTENDTQIKEGDDVIVCGRVINYKGNTPETQQNKAYIYSLNGEVRETGGGTGTPAGTGTQADPYNVAAAIAAVKNLTWTSNDDYQKTEQVYVKGKISRIAVDKDASQEYSSQYGNASFYISDDGTEAGEFYVYRALYLGNK